MPSFNRKTKPAKQTRTDEKAVVKNRRKWKSGTVALRAIRKQQQSTNTLLQRAPLQKVIREICNDALPEVDFYWQKSALDAIQIMVESEMITIFGRSINNMASARRTELMTKDWDLYLASLPCDDPLVSGESPTSKRK